MPQNFEVKCKKCENTAINMHGASLHYGTKIRIKLICSTCNLEEEIPITPVHISAFIKCYLCEAGIPSHQIEYK